MREVPVEDEKYLQGIGTLATRVHLGVTKGVEVVLASHAVTAETDIDLGLTVGGTVWSERARDGHLGLPSEEVDAIPVQGGETGIIVMKAPVLAAHQ